MYIPRILNLSQVVAKKSLFLFGPRQTGKSSLIKHTLKNARVYNLLNADVFRKLSFDPGAIRKEITGSGIQEIVVIDEIQRLPELLNEVHLMIEEYGIRFLLTGSSARSLRRKGVNLLAGRARFRYLHPFVSVELGAKFDLMEALNRGLLPSIYLSDAVEEDLRQYAGVYLKEEVAAEGLTRNIPAFSRFLEVAAHCSGSMLNYSKVASDAEVKRSTVVDYFQILRDTLIGYDLPALQTSTKRKPSATSKFYFFDTGVARVLRGEGPLSKGSVAFGQAFEHFIFHELRSYCDYHAPIDLHYWRSKSQFEVDFVLGQKVAIEVKAKSTISSRDLKGLMALQEEQLVDRLLVVSCSDVPMTFDKIEVLPYQIFLDKLWNGDLIHCR